MRAPLVLLAVGVLLVSGCASLAPASPEERAARERVERLALDVSHSNKKDINFFARAAVEQESGLVLIGIVETPAPTLTDVFGSLQFLVPPVTNELVYPPKKTGPFCFSVDFTLYGATSVLNGDRHSEIDSIECPENAVAVTPPIDETVHPVVAANAVEAATSVLLALRTPFPSEESIAASIADLLEAPEGEFVAAAPPAVVIEDGEIGVAMGTADDCVLVRLSNGVVEQRYAAPVLLQEGELGCNGGTALYPDLSSPH